MIVFLPFDSGAQGTACIKTLHKKDNLFVYEIEFSESSKQQESIDTQSGPVEPVEQFSALAQLYALSGLTPLSRITTGVFNVFAVIWSIDDELHSFSRPNSLFKSKYLSAAASSSKFVSLEVFDFDSTCRWTLRLWRDRASWIKKLVPGDCVLLWGVNCRGRGRILNSTARSQLFLLGSAHDGRTFHARKSNLSPEEMEICRYLESQAKMCPQTALPMHATMDLNVFECSAVIRERDEWILSGPTDTSYKIIFQQFDARTWILISELIESSFSRQIALKNITKDGFFTSKSSMILLDSHSHQQPFHDLAKALDSTIIFNGLITLKGRLQSFFIPSEESINTSITTSQPERWRLIVSGGLGQLILESSCIEESSAAEHDYILLVKTILESDGSIIRKTYSIVR